MIDVFLSASVPLPTRNRQYFVSADVLAIREAIKALVEVILPIGRITCGGHPAITPLIAFFVREGGLNSNHLTIYQSRIFEDVLPKENQEFQDIRIVNAVAGNRDLSLSAMRRAMIKSRQFSAGVFIGGMEGVVEEERLFTSLQPNSIVLPIASTGAAAADIFNERAFPPELATELTYPTLFRKYIPRYA